MKTKQNIQYIKTCFGCPETNVRNGGHGYCHKCYERLRRRGQFENTLSKALKSALNHNPGNWRGMLPNDVKETLNKIDSITQEGVTQTDVQNLKSQLGIYR